jgi:hypothetical protein
MMNPISSAAAVAHASYGFQPAANKSAPEPQPSSNTPQDKVSISNAARAAADHDGDSH